MMMSLIEKKRTESAGSIEKEKNLLRLLRIEQNS